MSVEVHDHAAAEHEEGREGEEHESYVGIQQKVGVTEYRWNCTGGRYGAVSKERQDFQGSYNLHLKRSIYIIYIYIN